MHLSRLLPFPSRDRGPRDCRCGHSSQAHEHYRRGTDCALCACQKYRAGAPAQDRDPRGARGERAAHAA